MAAVLMDYVEYDYKNMTKEEKSKAFEELSNLCTHVESKIGRLKDLHLVALDTKEDYR